MAAARPPLYDSLRAITPDGILTESPAFGSHASAGYLVGYLCRADHERRSLHE